jgi:hypothetical protein
VAEAGRADHGRQSPTVRTGRPGRRQLRSRWCGTSVRSRQWRQDRSRERSWIQCVRFPRCGTCWPRCFWTL